MPDDIAALVQRARAGDPAALTAIGRRLLTGDGIRANPQEGIAAITQAANRNHAEAIEQLAIFAAWGVLRPRNASEALDHLARAAHLGAPAAQKELRFLAQIDTTDTAVLRRAIDPREWTRARPLTVVREDPRIAVSEGFLTAAECDWLIARGANLRRAKVYSPDAAGYEQHGTRTNTETSFDIRNADVAVSLLRERIANTMGLSLAFFEVAKLLHYSPGEHFGLHADFLDTAAPALAQEVAQFGQRTGTFLVYLNDDFTGGETDFPELAYRFKGRKGDALYFRSVDARDEPDRRTVHAGLPPTTGEKWLLSQWIRNKPIGVA